MSYRSERKRLYHDRQLIESTLRENGVDPDDSQTWYRGKHKRRQRIAADLAAKSGIDASYCHWVLTDYFGQKNAARRLASYRAYERQIGFDSTSNVIPLPRH